MRMGMAAASLVIIGSLMTACGPPDDASKDDFCKAFDNVISDGDVRDEWREFGDVGTPSDISDDARQGFELVLDIGRSADDGGEFQDGLTDLDSDETSKVNKFQDYVQKTCPDLDDY